MFNKKTFLEEIDKNFLEFTEEQIEEIKFSDTCVSMIRKIIYILNTCNDQSKINFFNKMIIIHLSGSSSSYTNCHNFIIGADNYIWSYILDNFDDDKIHSLIVVIYLTLNRELVSVEYMLKIYKIMFADRRMCDYLIETELFFNEESNSYSNCYKTFMGLLLCKIAYSKTNYDSRVQKVVELFYIILKNKPGRPRFMSWLVGLINCGKNFINNYIYLEDFDKGILPPFYYKLVTEILFKLWDDAKKCKMKNKLENIDVDYLKKENCLLEWEDKTIKDNSNTKLFEDLFFYLIRLQNIYFNNVEHKIVEYEHFLNDANLELRQLQLQGMSSNLKELIIKKISESQLEVDELKCVLYDVKFCTLLKIFQKDIAIVINNNLKKNVDINNCILETNIDLINSLKIFEDGFYNYNYTNFENSVILINYNHLKNPFIRHKYSYYGSYYIVDNTSRNICDLRFKFIENNLLGNLIKFYIDLEDLEGDNFYEKNLARNNIINFINFICHKEPYIYGSQLKKFSECKDSKYIRFINLLINDLSSHFDDTFSILREIYEIEKKEIFISITNKELNYHDKPEHLNLFKKYRLSESLVGVLNFMFSFIVILSANCVNSLMSDELGEKFCSQLNYFLNELTCKTKRKSYNVKNKYDIAFQPLNILQFIANTFLNCMTVDKFESFMSKDARSFKKENIIFTANKLWSNHLMTEKDYKSLEKMAINIESKMLLEVDREVPDEFCDPLMASEITEPVLLPGTDTIMDKSVISRHLLTDLHNPFNRENLTLEELENYNNTESVKLKIEEFNRKKSEWEKSVN